MGILFGFLPFGMLARVPKRFRPQWLCYVIQATIGLAAGGWGYYRFQQVPLDLSLVESTALFGFALIISGLQTEYGLLVMISFILVGYGGVSPSRNVYMPALLLYAFVAMLLMYQTRTTRLLGERESTYIPGKRNYADWAYRGLHFFAFIIVYGILIVLLPFPHGQSVGIVPVSFNTTQELEFPLLWRSWLGTTPFASFSDEGKQTTNKGEMPSMLSKDADQIVEQEYAEANFDAREGAGGGVGTDLLFRVQSPAKLYWLGQLYDVYNGKVWKVSKLLKRGRGALDSPRFLGYQRITQQFSIEKAASRRLFGAYRAYQFMWTVPAENHKTTGFTSPRMQRMVWSRHVYGATLLGPKPPLPWRYNCYSVVPTVRTEGQKNVKRQRKKHIKEASKKPYLRLPQKIVSKRLRELATRITGDSTAPLQKAIAIRDYLRNNYTYNIEAPPIPENAEVVDYFLFESKEGYCQHFAQALTVLARLANLPARLATGYSPGHFNVLTGGFEVYEYHAHAWCQIFLDKYGWLTFDGVAPGQLRLENSPPPDGTTRRPIR